jgi:hypothetical protein
MTDHVPCPPRQHEPQQTTIYLSFEVVRHHRLSLLLRHRWLSLGWPAPALLKLGHNLVVVVVVVFVCGVDFVMDDVVSLCLVLMLVGDGAS